ncbi:leucine-rich repeat receptor-like serine/threonine-protein kinase At2g14510 isoform X2 [Fagus crenata]
MRTEAPLLPPSSKYFAGIDGIEEDKEDPSSFFEPCTQKITDGKPGNAVIYYPNRILKGLDPFEGGSRTRNPFSWIREAMSSTEQDVISISGYDTAVYFVFLSTGILIDCGATTKSTIDGREWLPDAGFISGGTSKNLTIPVLVPTLSSVRSFPLRNNLHNKFCYVVPVYRTAKYLIRTTYFYGGINGFDSPLVFDQIVDGTLWSVVNTTDDYANGLSSYYEGVFVAQGRI